ncbi:Succinyl-diaminopimelate desuccinylase [Buchnera aphidicola (Neophyllaphis podocarpi)]|uniref:succinyl-diaminopimelate desuccinylase n=1 Tax=Buchnera aphidicola TaxID=9 RepID=UPI0034649A04
MSCPVTKLAQKLIYLPSISPHDLGCQKIIINRLLKIGFNIEDFKINNTDNFWAWRGTGKTLNFLGHTDVVPSGPVIKWKHHPFKSIIKNGVLFGRGASDMKGALAAMIIAVENFVFFNPRHIGRISFIITSDEESNAEDGTKKVVEKLIAKNEFIDYCLVGEPTSNLFLGDCIKNGRRGSLNAYLIIFGIQGHIAYPYLADNPIHKSLSILKELINHEWSKENNFFSKTQIQISNINSNNNSINTIPGSLFVNFNFRFNNDTNFNDIKLNFEKLLIKHKIKYSIKWNLSGNPFITKKGKLLDTVINSIKHYTSKEPELSTSGGTSDGRFFHSIGSEVIEFGLLNKTIHKINECVNISDLKMLSSIYYKIIEKIFI